MSASAQTNNFHRIDLHGHLRNVAIAETGGGSPAQLRVCHQAIKLDPTQGKITFDNGNEAVHDVVVCADGIRSQMREQLGIVPDVAPSTSCCYRCIISAEKLRGLGLGEFAENSAIEFRGGNGIDKIVMSPAQTMKLLVAIASTRRKIITSKRMAGIFLPRARILQQHSPI